MTAVPVGDEVHRRLASRHTAEIVAEELRRQILNGELADGDLLPGQKHLVERFDVSLVSLRQALRILETEGLLSVRRGNRGGAVVHAPAKTSAAYMLGLVLQKDGVPLSDVQLALRDLESSCAAFAARRADRATTIVPQLARLNASTAERIEDPEAFTDLGREFHYVINRECGNHTMVAVMESLDILLLDAEQQWVHLARTQGGYPTMAKRRSLLNAHVKLTEAIADGDVARARRLAANHITDTHDSYQLHEGDRRVRASPPQALARFKR